jgi:hypothetical protein
MKTRPRSRSRRLLAALSMTALLLAAAGAGSAFAQAVDDPALVTPVDSTGITADADIPEPAPMASGPMDAFATEPAVETAAEADAVVGPIIPVDSGPVPDREMDEPEQVLQLLPDVVRSVLSGPDQFKYDPHNRPDPMIVPWVRLEVLSSEHLAQARAYLNEADEMTSRTAKMQRYQKAKRECEEVLRINQGSKFAEDAQALRDKIQELINGIDDVRGGPVIARQPTAKFPEWVVINTKAVIYDQTGGSDHIALVGDDMLTIGDEVPKYPEVKVVDITRDAVTYAFQYDPNQASVQQTVRVEEEIDAR